MPDAYRYSLNIITNNGVTRNEEQKTEQFIQAYIGYTQTTGYKYTVMSRRPENSSPTVNSAIMIDAYMDLSFFV